MNEQETINKAHTTIEELKKATKQIRTSYYFMIYQTILISVVALWLVLK